METVMTETNDADTIVVEDLDPYFLDEVASLPGGENIKRCFACGTCVAGCPVACVADEYDSRKIIRKVLLGMREEVLKSPALWLCMLCYRCYARCPQEVNFTDVVKALRHLAIRDGHAPPDMLANSDEVDRLAQMLRRDMINDTVEGRTQVAEELKAMLDAATEKGR